MVKLTIILGRELFDYSGNSNSTWRDVIKSVEESAGIDRGGIRLIFKGRAVVPSESLRDAGVKENSRLLAMKTRQQHEDERTRTRRQQAKEAVRKVEQMKGEMKGEMKSETAVSGLADPSKSVSFGDDISVSESEFFVRVLYAGKTSRIKIESDSLPSFSIANLKLRLKDMCNLSVQHQNLIYAGKRDLPDESRLVEDLRVKRGANMMLLAKAQKHSTEEARVDINALSGSLEALETSVKTVESRVRGRLLCDYAELVAAITPLEVELNRLTSNTEVLRLDDCDADATTKLNEIRPALSDLGARICALRRHASDSLKSEA